MNTFVSLLTFFKVWWYALGYGFNKVRMAKGFGKMRGILDIVMIAVMLPVVLTLLSGIATTGDETTDAMLTAITAIVPIILIMDVLSGLF